MTPEIESTPLETPIPFEETLNPTPPVEPPPAFSNYPPQSKRSFTKFIYFSFIGIAILVLILGLAMRTSNPQISKEPEVTTDTTVTHPLTTQCVLYAVLESGDNDSQLITIDPKTKTITPFGDLQKGMQIENIAFNQRSQTLFANSSNEGQLYTIDTKTGIFSLIGQAHSGEITAFTIHPTDGTHWGWAKESGLIAIKPQELSDTLLYPSLKRGSALTWNNDGTLLYGSFKDDTELFTYDTNKNTYNPLAFNLPTATRGFSMLTGDILLGINLEKEGTSHIYEFDPAQKLVTKELSIDTPGSEPRGIAWDPTCGDPL